MSEKCTDNPRDCPMVSRVEALEKANDTHSETHREIFKRLNAVERETGEQGVTLKNIDRKLDKLIEWQDEQRDRLAKIDSIDELSKKVADLEAKPGKRWENLVACVLSALAGAFALWLASGMPGVAG